MTITDPTRSVIIEPHNYFRGRHELISKKLNKLFFLKLLLFIVCLIGSISLPFVLTYLLYLIDLHNPFQFMALGFLAFQLCRLSWFIISDEKLFHKKYKFISD